MRRQNLVLGAVVMVGVAALAPGCSSDSSGCADGGDAACTSGKDGAATSDVATASDSADAADRAFGFTKGDSTGTSCFVVTAVAPGSSDGCEIGVADATKVDPANFLPITLPLNYDGATGIVTLGTDGSLGRGAISVTQGTRTSMGTLLRENDTSDPNQTTCTWHQTDQSILTLIADDTFTVSVTEVESMFAAAPACSTVPTGGTCTSTWTWTMAKSAKTPPCK